jgi:hypothetical protein
MVNIYLADSIAEYSYTTGTGAYLFGGPWEDNNIWGTFSSFLKAGQYTYYFARDYLAQMWECGIGQMQADGTLVRYQIINNNIKNGLKPISWGSGVRHVFCQIPAQYVKSNGVAPINNTVLSVTAIGPNLYGGTITSIGSIGLASTGVSAGSYILPSLSVNAQGQITSMSNVAIGNGISLVNGTLSANISYANLPINVQSLPIVFTFGTLTSNASTNVPLTINCSLSSLAVVTTFCTTAPTSNAIFNLSYTTNGVTWTNIGNVVLENTSVIAYASNLQSVTLVSGDIITMNAPIIVDGSLANPAITIEFLKG